MRPLLFAGLLLCLAYAMANKTVVQHSMVSNKINNFSSKFFKSVDGFDKNSVASPLSIYLVLAMAAFGAEGNTAKQMQESLELPANDELSLKEFESLLNYLQNVDKVTLEIANKMFLANNLSVKDTFKQLASGSFKSEVSQVNMNDAKKTAEIINGWVAETTHQKIKEIVTDGDISPDMRMSLLNAVYFKGKWAQPFVKDKTVDKPFHLNEKNEISVPMMHRVASTFYGELPDLKSKFVQLSYENKDIRMIIVLPDANVGLSEITKNLESINHHQLLKSGTWEELDLHLPKFKIESSNDLKDILERLGMTDMFTDGANFHGISNEQLKVSKVVQKAFIEVNEEGSEAAAVTHVGMVLKSARIPKFDPIKFVVDRPFYYCITTPDVKLFEGFVINPAA